MAVDQDQRPSFYQGQYLGPEDLTATVEYGRIQHARHSLGAHTWGIAIGLQLVEKPSPAGNNQVDLFLTPGYAWDGFGRSIVVLAPAKVSPQLFTDIYDASVDDPSKSGDTAAGHPVKVWLRYSENENQPAANGFQVCGVSDQNSRVQETFSLMTGELVNISDQRDPVSIGGKTIDAQQALVTFDASAPQVYDASIPEQALPDDDAQAVWLIPAGYARWLPAQTSTQTGSFQKRTAKDLTKSEAARQYIGVVAGTVEAAGQNVQIKTRGTPPSTTASDDLLWVEGKMRIEGDLNLFGGKISFLNSGGQDEGVPLLIQRAKQIDQSTLQPLTSLQVEIGTDNKGNNMFSVGPLDTTSSKLTQVFNVMDNGKAGVGTFKPRNPFGVRGTGQWEELLSFEDPSGTTKWHINQNPNGNNPGLNFSETGVSDFRIFIRAGGNIGMGTASPTGRLTLSGIVQPAQGNLTLFSQTADIEYDGGSDQLFVISATGNANTAFMGGNIGIATTAPSNRLHVADATGIRQGRLYMSGDVGWNSLTYNAYHAVNNAGWVFPDSTRTAATIEMDDSGGTSRFEVWTTTSAAKNNFQQRFRIDGETGNVGINTGAPDGKLTITSTDPVQGKISFFNPGADMRYDGGSDGVFWFVGTNNAKTAFLGGNFGVNVANPQAPLDVGGNVNISGDITANGNNYPSDVRLKRDIRSIEHALDQLLQLRGISFYWNEPDKKGGNTSKQMGLIAQEVERVFPEWVKEGVDGYKVVGQQGFVALMIEAVRELKEQVSALARRVNLSEQTE